MAGIDPKIIDPTQAEVNAAMLQILALDGSAYVQFSEYTGCWFLHTKLHFSDGYVLTGITEHARTPNDAVWAVFCRLREIDKNEFDRIIVANDHQGDKRRHYRWNGAVFAEQPVEWFKPKARA